MAAINIIEKTKIDGWHSLSGVSDNRGVYIIGIKNAPSEGDAFNIDNLKYVSLELGIDSGIDKQPITIQRVNLRFNEYTGDETINKITALGQTSVLPKQGTYIRVVSFSDGMKEYK